MSDFVYAGQLRACNRQFDSGPMTQIRTRQLRRLRSPQVGEIVIEHIYVDRPATLETWIDHCAALGVEFGLSTLDIHTALFAQLPEIFGP